MMSHTYIPQPMSLPSINFLHLTVSEIQPRQTFLPPAHPDAMNESNIQTVLYVTGLWGKKYEAEKFINLQYVPTKFQFPTPSGRHG